MKPVRSPRAGSSKWGVRLRSQALALGIFFAAAPGSGHEVRPAYLEFRESAAGVDVVFKQPTQGTRGLRLEPHWPAHCRAGAHERDAIGGSALVDRWRLDCGERGLRGHTVSVSGLEATLTDVVLRIELANGAEIQTLLRPEAPEISVSERVDRGLASYFGLGVEHLVLGFDHVLFVLCLLFLMNRLTLLVQTITAFTLAHSITLGLSALGFVRVPQGPVEAIIALSILLLAVEKLRGTAGSLTLRRPWLVALAFGLLHGFGFAGALSDIGLPRSDALAALFLFNVGVEVGQLAIVLVAFAFAAFWRRLPLPEDASAWATTAMLYAIGSLGSWWWIDRTVAVLGGS